MYLLESFFKNYINVFAGNFGTIILRTKTDVFVYTDVFIDDH